eukprot:RCo050885
MQRKACGAAQLVHTVPALQVFHKGLATPKITATPITRNMPPTIGSAEAGLRREGPKTQPHPRMVGGIGMALTHSLSGSKAARQNYISPSHVQGCQGEAKTNHLYTQGAAGKLQSIRSAERRLKDHIAPRPSKQVRANGKQSAPTWLGFPPRTEKTEEVVPKTGCLITARGEQHSRGGARHLRAGRKREGVHSAAALLAEGVEDGIHRDRPVASFVIIVCAPHYHLDQGELVLADAVPDFPHGYLKIGRSDYAVPVRVQKRGVSMAVAITQPQNLVPYHPPAVREDLEVHGVELLHVGRGPGLEVVHESGDLREVHHGDHLVDPLRIHRLPRQHCELPILGSALVVVLEVEPVHSHLPRRLCGFRQQLPRNLHHPNLA